MLGLSVTEIYTGLCLRLRRHCLRLRWHRGLLVSQGILILIFRMLLHILEPLLHRTQRGRLVVLLSRRAACRLLCLAVDPADLCVQHLELRLGNGKTADDCKRARVAWGRYGLR